MEQHELEGEQKGELIPAWPAFTSAGTYSTTIGINVQTSVCNNSTSLASINVPPGVRNNSMTTAINIPTGDDKDPKMSVYRYDTLNYGHQEIRTILLLPGTPSFPICCTLETHHLNAVSLQYETLSYEWGDSKSEERSI
jgi:hypothetical protein